jgi:hypothetical protein
VNLEASQQPPDVGLDDVGASPQFVSGGGNERGPLFRGVQVEGVNVERLATCRHQIELEDIEGGVLRQATNPVAPITDADGGLVAIDIQRQHRRQQRWRARRGRRCRRQLSS